MSLTDNNQHVNMIFRLAIALCALTLWTDGAPLQKTEEDMARGANVPSLAQYLQRRQRFLRDEQNLFPGSKLNLSSKEEQVNAGLMFAKRSEILSPPKDGFPPSRYFIDAKKDIEASNVFDFLRHLPKGSALHGHDLGMVSSQWVISNVTYRDHLFVRGVIPENRINGASLEFRFMPERKGGMPGDKVEPGDWHRLSTVRAQSGNIEFFDKWLKEQLTLEVDQFSSRTKTLDEVWKAFEQRFQVLFSLLSYRPVFVDYYRQTLQEFMEDNVQFLELRVMLPEVYTEDGKVLGPVDVAQLYADVTKEFVRENKDRFFGARIIYAPRRFVSPHEMEEFAETMKQLKRRFGDFIVGFDLVGQEDKGRPLIEFASELLEMVPDTKFFFHAGETNAHGWTDENMVDAILLNTSRMGHGFALVNHPLVLEEMKRRDVAIELNPISNQVLLLVSDLRNHPGSVLLSSNSVPVVISSDDPGLWGARGLSYDWYAAFMGMTSLQTDLTLLKQLAYNSVRYTALPATEKYKLMALWMRQWDNFIDRVTSPDEINLSNDV